MRCLTRSSGRIYWAALAFMAGAAVLITVVGFWYLLPALEAARNAGPAEKKQLAAHARLLLAVVLFIVIAGMLLTFRVSRFFRPEAGAGPRTTNYVDAWSESGKRARVPPEDKQEP